MRLWVWSRVFAFVFPLIFASLTATGHAQSKRNLVAVNPVALAFNVIEVEFERALDTDKGLSLRVARNVFGPGEISGTKFEIFVFGGKYKVYHGSNPPKGTWAGLGLAYGIGDYWETDGSASAENLKGLAISLELGHRFFFKGLFLAPMVVYQVPIAIGVLAEKGDVDNPFFGGIMVGVQCGVAWGW